MCPNNTTFTATNESTIIAAIPPTDRSAIRQAKRSTVHASFCTAINSADYSAHPQTILTTIFPTEQPTIITTVAAAFIAAFDAAYCATHKTAIDATICTTKSTTINYSF